MNFTNSQVDRQPDGMHLLHLFEVTAQQSSGEVKCVARFGREQTVYHTELIVFPEIYTEENEVDFETPLQQDDNEAVDPHDADCPAYIICGLQDCTALIGGKVVLEVIYGGHPEPVIKWLKAVSFIVTHGNRIGVGSKSRQQSGVDGQFRHVIVRWWFPVRISELHLNCCLWLLTFPALLCYYTNANPRPTYSYSFRVES